MFRKTKIYPDKIVPLTLTTIVFVVLCFVLYFSLIILNQTVVNRDSIVLHIRLSDILIGTTIYLKTAIDFAIYIGRLMHQYDGWKNRIMIEIGTALGNALGTIAVLVVWDIFREVKLLMAAMIILAAMVLFRLAEEGLEHVHDKKLDPKSILGIITPPFEKSLQLINHAFSPLLNRLVPQLSVTNKKEKGYKALFWLSFTIPFILGLDDFAGYIPLFNIVNVFGFSIGVFLGHMILNIFLFLSPKRTIGTVKNPIISFIGSIAFVGLAFWGLLEAIKLLSS